MNVYDDDYEKRDNPNERNARDEYETGPEGDYGNVASPLGDAVSDGYDPPKNPRDPNEGLANGRYKAQDEDERIQKPEDDDDPLRGSLMTEERKQRLFNAVKTSYRELRHNRELNRTLVEEYAGPMYVGDDGKPVKYVNLLAQAVEAYTMILVGSNPQCYATAVDPSLKGFAAHYNIAVNNLLDEIEIGETFREWVRNSFFSMGIIKCHMADSGQLVAEDDILMDPGMPFASVVSVDDWVHDCTARKFSEAKFLGDCYRIPFDELQNGAYFEDAIEGLTPSTQLDESGERVDELSREENISGNDFDDMIDLIDIFIPRDGLIYTFAVSERNEMTLKGDVLAVQEYNGAETGPYKILGFQHVPENCMPVPPATQWVQLDRLANNLMRKASRQAKRSKKVLGYTPQGAADAMRVKRAGDGDMVEMTDPNEVVPMQLGGVDSQVNAFMLQSMELFDRMAGNLSAIMGLGASADSVGQEKLIHGATTRMEQSMQAIVNKASNGVVKELAGMLFADEYTTVPGEMTLKGTDISAQSNWTPDYREGMFSDYKVQLDVYSMNYQGPGDRVMVLNQLLQTMYAPLLPLLQQQGGTIDMQTLTQRYAEMLNQPIISEIVQFQQAEMLPEQGGQQQQQQGKAPVTNRTYTRRNESAGDNSGVPQTPVPAPAEPQT